MMASPDVLIETPKMSKQNQIFPLSNLVNELLTGMRLRGVQYRRIQTGPVFGIGFEDKPGHAYFHFLAVGTAFLCTDDGELHKLSAGSAVFMPHGRRHQLLSDAGIAFQDIEKFDVAPLGESVSGVDTCPSTHPVPSAVIFYGCMEFDLGGMQGIGKLMPTVMVADTQAQGYPGLLPVLDSMKREICAGRIGFAGILARLAEVAAAMIVRGWIECGCENASGLLAALRDPRLARAILALHRQPGREWTVAQLAAECHISRSVFAQRFETTIGVPPLRYATELRMRLARQLLTHERVSIDVVARRLGYTSQAAFSRAFKRVIGKPPGACRQML
ncbi:RCS-specific HTH-type transcriptional activator RclR [Janthinobacterium sp. HH103]|uniref:AraC family transcriptional regulator n=1 Tax=unclassified Janthinobacterium TaxID=2610881 RepID=UPI0008756010|nr:MULTISPECIES: AraC family transcriptional regulator [unclassified Janthinobacterium]OEZ64656.1 RCS-specific HTH-type transcriptional activator RclR [Janthinobacterium sp. HH100]OEZ84084.1 RCS-specific HTH-type transcriptional activator RclR [Janthinobacterium sp. HH103]QOU74913.1 RCS-specific HTH-type transcriptional activator RclR [Janthinobacterium sp. HH102]